MNVFGMLLFCLFKIIQKKEKKYGPSTYFPIGKTNWGGFSVGCVFLCDKRETERTRNHEFGHSVQNCFFGPFMIPLTILSILRYHFRKILAKIGYPSKSSYDDFWFEGQATRLGEKYISLFKKGDD